MIISANVALCVQAPAAEWEPFHGELFMRDPNEVYHCLICAGCAQMTGVEAFVMHIEGKKHHQVSHPHLILTLILT